jgi:hypothetical protein
MAIISTTSFAKALWPGVNAWYGKAYNEHEVEWTDLFDKHSSKRAYEEDVGVTGFGLAALKPQGQGITYDDESQAYITRYMHNVYALGFIVTREMVDDDLYDVVAQRRAKGLAFSMRQTKETIAANVYNRAFNSSYAGGDGKELCATDHPNFSGGTWSNEGTGADITQAGLEAACIAISKWTNDRGLKIAVRPQTLIIAPDEAFNVERILGSQYETAVATGGANRNVVNPIYGKFNVKTNHYLTDIDAWFLRTNVPNGMKCFQRRAMDFSIDNDFDSENAKFKATERYSFGWTDPRAVYGQLGA